MRRKLVGESREKRREARKAIVKAANKTIPKTSTLKPFSQRRIQDAVCVVRRNELLPPGVLKRAGFHG